jgi:hypothetical protein
MDVIHRDIAHATGTDSATAFVEPGNGISVARNLWFDSPAAGTLVANRAKQETTANAAVSNSDSLDIDTDSAGKVGGAVLTTNDYVIVQNSSGTGDIWYLQSISNVGAVSGSVVTLTLGGNIYCAASDAVFVVRAADIVTMTTADETVNNLQYAFNGYEGMPIGVVLTATGECRVSVAVDYEK